MSSRALVKFTEQRYPVLFEDFRVYIQGVEVTPWITSALTITKANRDGPGTASFTLDNAMDRFIMTAENVTGVWRDTQDKYSEAAKHAIYLYKKGETEVTIDRIQEQFAILYERAWDLALAKSRKQVLEDLGRRSSPGETDTLQETLAIRDSVQQMPSELFDTELGMNKLKAAVAAELISGGTDTQTAMDIADDEVNREKKKITTSKKAREKEAKKARKKKRLELESGDPEAKGKYARQANLRNPTDSDTGDSRWPLSERSVIFHKNDTIRIFLQNPFTEEDQWIFGFTGFVDSYPVTTDYVTSQSTIQIQCYDLKALMQKMRIQMNAPIGLVQPSTLFTDRSSVFADMIVPSRWGHSFANMKFEDAIAILTTGTNLERKGQGPKFGIGNLSIGKVVRYPKTKDPHDDVNKAVLEEWHTLCVNGPSEISDTESIARTEFYTSKEVDKIGRGSTIDGPYSPLRTYVHLLLPKDGTAASTLTSIQFDAGTEQRDWTHRFEVITDFCARLDYEFSVAPNGDVIFEFPMYDFMPEDFGDWRGMFEADYHLINGNMSDESGDIITSLIVTGGPPNSTTSPDLPPAFTSGVIQSSLMAARVGVTTEQASIPFVQSASRLRSFGFIEFQKRLSNANSFDMEWGFRPFLAVNRPIYNKVEKRMGITSSISETLQVFGVCSTGTTVRFVRQVRPDGTFRFITGGDSLPISYRTIYSNSVKSAGNAKVGVRTTLEQDGDPTTLEDQKSTTQPKNDDKPPFFIKETRPGTYFSLTPKARQIADIIGQTVKDRGVLLTNIPKANGSEFSIRARNPEGQRIYSDPERNLLAQQAKAQGYILIDTQQRFIFEVRRPGQPDIIVRPENAR